MKMCQAFAHNGHDIHLLVPNIFDDRETGVEDVHKYYGVEPCFTITYLPWPPIKGRAYFHGWFAARYSKNLKPDLVYGRNIIGCYFTSKVGLPVVFESHAPITNSGKIASWLFNELLKQKSFSYLVVITQSLRQWYLKNYNIPTDKILVAADGADLPKNTEHDQIDSFSPQSADTFRVGYVGHLYPGKGMEIISKLVVRCPDLEFHIVGGLEEDIRLWKNQLQGYGNIIFHGYRPHRDIPKIMDEMNVLISPSLRSIKLPGKKDTDISQWTSPLKIFEYMAARKPIVASDVDVLREVLKNGRNALLCDPDDLEAWQWSLYRLRDCPNLSQALSQNAYHDLKNRYCWKTRAKEVLTSVAFVNT
ncbi:MAG: glycosyltransferase family 4 protein [Leptolyngbyaceae cyanobacterium MO_188.B28]|nr:glycosyltransferase family 4 protein [Leptolyngbyaceae cyanobacterium MO_188.B28]